MYKNVIFDLDGTLMDTLEDIKNAVNKALELCEFSYRYTYETAKSIIGAGATILMERSLKQAAGDYSPELFEKYKATYLPLYKEYQDKTTAPYKGMNEVLIKLKEKGIKCYILTNKPSHLTEIVVNRFFSSQIDGFMGQSNLYPPKPDRAFTNALLEKYNLNPNECVYVGDSYFDIMTAKNANLDMILCKYGYGDYNNLDMSYPKYKIDSPIELLDILIKKE